MSEAARRMSDQEKLIAEWHAQRMGYSETIRRLQTEHAAWTEAFKTTQLTRAIAKQEAIEREVIRCRTENAKLKGVLGDIAKSAFACPGTPLVCSCAEHKAARALKS